MISDLLIAVGRMNLAILASVFVLLTLRPATLLLFGARVRYGLWSVVPVAAIAILTPTTHKVVYLSSNVPAVGHPLLGMALLAAWVAGSLAAVAVMTQRQRRFVRGGATQGPAVVGLIRPKIHLPADFEARFSLGERTLIMAHERHHLARQDARINAALALAQCVLWFNPAVHLTAWLARQDQELACDEAVLARFPWARKTYAEALLKTQFASATLPLGCNWSSPATRSLERRIKRLKAPAHGPGRRRLGAWLTGLLVAGFGYAAWASQPAKIVVAIADTAPSPHGNLGAHLPRSRAMRRTKAGGLVSTTAPDVEWAELSATSASANIIQVMPGVIETTTLSPELGEQTAADSALQNPTIPSQSLPAAAKLTDLAEVKDSATAPLAAVHPTKRARALPLEHREDVLSGSVFRSIVVQPGGLPF